MVSWLGGGKKLRGNTAGTADLNLPKGYLMLHDIVFSHKVLWKGGERWTLVAMVFVFLLCMLRPCFPGSDWTSACWWEVLNEVFILFSLHVELCFTYKTVFISTHTFLAFTLPILTRAPLRRSQQDTRWGISSCLESTQHREKGSAEERELTVQCVTCCVNNTYITIV